MTKATSFPLSLSTDVTEAQADDEGGTLIARKVGEAVQNTLGAVVTAIDIPLGGPGSVCVGCKGCGMRVFAGYPGLSLIFQRLERLDLSWASRNQLQFYICLLLQHL